MKHSFSVCFEHFDVNWSVQQLHCRVCNKHGLNHTGRNRSRHLSLSDPMKIQNARSRQAEADPHPDLLLDESRVPDPVVSRSAWLNAHSGTASKSFKADPPRTALCVRENVVLYDCFWRHQLVPRLTTKCNPRFHDFFLDSRVPQTLPGSLCAAAQPGTDLISYWFCWKV